VVGMRGHSVGSRRVRQRRPKRNQSVELTPRSNLASRILFHALFGTRDIRGAFREMARLRSLKHSDEHERILMEMRADTLRDLQTKPDDRVLNELLRHIREEVKARPVRQ
jgi:hypothetical protein